MNSSMDLVINQTVLDSILLAARRAGSQECMGLLAGGVGKGAGIVGACLLPARASGSHAEADPLALREAIEFFRKQRQRPIGLWHSHGNHSVFHSATDDDTVMRLFPAMAEWGFELPSPAWPVPAVTDPDGAVVPLNDGRWLRFTVVGPSIPGTHHAHERAAWDRFNVVFRPHKVALMAVLSGGWLRLFAGGVELRLGVPEGATVMSRVEDHTSLRSARLFSLVVNRRGEHYAEVVNVHDFDGETHVTKQACRVAVITETEGTRPANLVADVATGTKSFCLDSTLGSQGALSGHPRETVS